MAVTITIDNIGELNPTTIEATISWDSGTPINCKRPFVYPNEMTLLGSNFINMSPICDTPPGCGLCGQFGGDFCEGGTPTNQHDCPAGGESVSIILVESGSGPEPFEVSGTLVVGDVYGNSYASVDFSYYFFFDMPPLPLWPPTLIPEEDDLPLAGTAQGETTNEVDLTLDRRSGVNATLIGAT